MNDSMSTKEPVPVTAEIPKKSSKIGTVLLWILGLGAIFLLLAGWIALLLAPPFGTALAVIVAIVVMAFFR